MPKKIPVIPSPNAQVSTSSGTFPPEVYSYLKGLGDVLSSTQSRMTIKTSAVAPTVADIADTDCQVWKNTTSGQLRLYANDGGVLKSIQLT